MRKKEYLPAPDLLAQHLQFFMERNPSYTFFLLGNQAYPIFQRKEGYDLIIDEKPLYGRDDILSWHSSYWLENLPKEISHLYILGLGLGYSYYSLRSWLTADSRRKITFLEEDPKMLLSFFSLEEAKNVLHDPQAEILLLLSDDLEDLSSKEAALVAAPHQTDRQRYDSLKKALFRKITLQEGVSLDRSHSHIPFSHFLENYPKALEAFYPQRWRDAFKGIPAILCGAGPSLELGEDFLRKAQDKALLFAGGSAIAALSSKDIPFHFGMALDPNREEYVRLKPAVFPDIPLLYIHRTLPEIFSLFSSPNGYVRSAMGQVVDLWVEEKWGENGSLIGEDLSDEAMSVTTLLLSLIAHLGCDPIILCGVDLAYVSEKRYASGVGVEKGELFRSTAAAEEERFELDGKNGKVDSCTRWLMEIETLSDFARKHPEKKLYDASPLGAKLQDIPFLSFETILEDSLTHSWDLSSWIHTKIMQDKKIDQSSHKNSMDELIQSIINCQQLAEKIAHHLQNHNEISGKAVLYEMELEGEIAYQLIFYDTLALLQKQYGKDKELIWNKLTQVLNRFLSVVKK